MNAHHSRRRGLVSVAMLIGLLVVGLVATSLFKVANGRRTLARIDENQRQVDLLADSGLDRALARLEANPHYTGEVWEIAAAELGGRGAGRVTILVQNEPNQASQRQVMVQADYLVAVPGPVRQSRWLTLFDPPKAR